MSFIEFLGHRKYNGVSVVQAFNPVEIAGPTHTRRVKGNPKHITSDDEYQAYINRYDGKAQVYIGVNPVKKGLKGFPTYKDVLVWCNELLDLDLEKPQLIDEDVPAGYPKKCKHYAAREDDLKKLEPYIERINQWLTLHGFKTGYQDHTGNGYRWILPIPGLDLTGHDLESLAAKKKEFKQQIARDCDITDGCGVHLDSVFDFRRITGVPGTLNFKLGTETRKNRIREPFRGVERDEDEVLRDYIIGIELPEKPKPQNIPQAENRKDLTYRLEGDEKLRTLYNGDISGYISRSEAELALACRLVYYGFNESEIKDIILSAKIGKAVEKKKKGHNGYLQHTIRRAFEFTSAQCGAGDTAQNKKLLRTFGSRKLKYRPDFYRKKHR